MTTFEDLKKSFQDSGYKLIIVADGETRSHEKTKEGTVLKTPAGGVSVSFDAVCRATNATYIARGKTDGDREVVDERGKVEITTPDGDYTLKRLFFSEQEIDEYYFGFSNQTLWPLCHTTFERPIFRQEWYEGYKVVNKRFAEAIQEEIVGKTFVWINDYQLSLVPTYLGKQKDVVVGCFWHIPWPTWETFRIMPYKKDILWSLLSCDYLAFHRNYQVRNFLETVAQEMEARIDRDRNRVFFDENALQVASEPMGVDTDVIKTLVTPQPKQTYLIDMLRQALDIPETKEEEKGSKTDPLTKYFDKYKVILGIDRLDYTKGLLYRLQAVDAFFANNPEYIEKVIYLGIMSPSREKIPSYKVLRKQVETLASNINKKYATKGWKPLQMIYQTFSRDDIVNFYNKAAANLVTPVDDGMNLVSKEFVIASSTAEDPGMLILSQFAGSALDLTASIIVNPYDVEEVSRAIKKALEMPIEEKKERVDQMISFLDEHNIYEWARNFTQHALHAAGDNKRFSGGA